MRIAVKVVVASTNPVKTAAAREAFRSQFPGVTLEIQSVDVDSGAGDQPDSDDKTRQGAKTRALQASNTIADADFWIGLEGGIEVLDNQLMAFAWMAVLGRSGAMSEARSATLPLPPAIKELVDTGMELGAANDRVFATVNSKQEGGAYGLLTDGLYTRESIYTQTLTLALIPFVSALYPQSTNYRTASSR